MRRTRVGFWLNQDAPGINRVSAEKTKELFFFTVDLKPLGNK